MGKFKLNGQFSNSQLRFCLESQKYRTQTHGHIPMVIARLKFIRISASDFHKDLVIILLHKLNSLQIFLKCFRKQRIKTTLFLLVKAGGEHVVVMGYNLLSIVAKVKAEDF